MSIPKEPRQLMINLMYLVLTAMLALNITREVLTAFQTINTSIESSNSTISGKNAQFYQQFDKLESNKDEADKVKPLNDKAKEVKAASEELVRYLESWKDTVIARSGGYITNDAGEKEIKSMEDIDASTKLFVESKKGDEIKTKLLNYVDFILAKVENPDARAAIKAQIPVQIIKPKSTEENPAGDWAYGTFHNIPVVAAIAMLSKFQNDVKNSESMVVEHLFKQIHADDIQIDEMMPVAVPNTSYALEGDEITATITLAAYNKAVNPSISSNRGAVSVKEGVGTLKFRASGAGLQTVNGVISMVSRGKTKTYPYKFEYMVGSAGASLQLDKMNVMYIGVPNPVTISAAGYNIEDVRLSIPGAQDIKSTGKGTYDVFVNKATNDMPYEILARTKAGGTSSVLKGKLRVKMIPNPEATVAGKSSGMVPTATAKAEIGVLAQLKNFDFDARFIVTSYRFTWLPRNGQPKEVEISGPYLNKREDIKQYIQASKPGDKWIFDEIKARGPDNTVRPINSITLTLN